MGDYDGDGKAEVAMKTADGTVDRTGTVIGSSSADYRNSSGHVLSGPEYLTMFNGETGKAMRTVDHAPARGTVSSWGDSYGNRVDRFLAGTAYLDGSRPSLVMARGYCTRTVIAAWDWRGGAFTRRWTFDTNSSTATARTGSCTARWPSTPTAAACGTPGTVTGTPRMWVAWAQTHRRRQRPGRLGGRLGGQHGRRVVVLGRERRTGPEGRRGREPQARGHQLPVLVGRHTVRELLDDTHIDKYGTSSDTRLLTGSGVHSGNGTKATPSLSGDLLGDCRDQPPHPSFFIGDGMARAPRPMIHTP